MSTGRNTITRSAISRPRPQPDCHTRLICVPYAGSGALAFHSWAALFPPGLEMCAIELPGRANRLSEPSMTALPPLIEALVPELQPYLDVPFVIYGHSMGALIAFELARYLRRHLGLEPRHLFFSARPAPQLVSRMTPIHHLPDAEFVEQLRVRYNGIPQIILQEPELLKLFLPAMRADFTLLETYTYTPDEPFACPITVFGGTVDITVNEEELREWSAQTHGEFNLHMFHDGHFFIHNHVTAFLQTLSGYLSY
jgi:medium-chain acyl-[acyl-carrier-protein] hydrolase